MALEYRSGSTAGNASGGNLAVNKPSGTADGDILIAILYREAGSWTLPSGWAYIQVDGADDFRDYGANEMYASLAWKRASSEGSSWEFQISTTTWRTVSIAAFSGGLASGTPHEQADDYEGVNHDLSAILAPSITPTVDNNMLVIAGGCYDGLNWSTPSQTYSQGPYLGGNELWYKAQATAGATGSITMSSTPAHTGGGWACAQFDLKPAAGLTLTATQSGSNINLSWA